LGKDMELLKIDRDKCKKDGICVAECPMAIIQLDDADEGYPSLIPGMEAVCLRCGHCIAVCPHGALRHASIPMDRCPPLVKDLTIGHKEAVQFLRSRRSVRLYRDKPVEKEKIQTLIEIARYAPSAGNRQMVNWLVVTDPDKIHRLSKLTVDWMRFILEKGPEAARAPYFPAIVNAWDKGVDRVLRDAPVVVLAHAPKEALNGMVDLTLALSYFELAAPTLGLGTCWAGLLQGALLSRPEIKKELGLPENHPHHYPMMLGYTKLRYYRLPERKPPKIVWG
jgi:nitroreductase/NAD-dependent dihydropyrimidine dehydrogenase PreA subunit